MHVFDGKNSISSFLNSAIFRYCRSLFPVKHHTLTETRAPTINVEASLLTSTLAAHPYPNIRLVHQGKGTAYPRQTHTAEQLRLAPLQPYINALLMLPTRVCWHVLTTDWLPAPLLTRHCHVQVWGGVEDSSPQFGWQGSHENAWAIPKNRGKQKNGNSAFSVENNSMSRSF